MVDMEKLKAKMRKRRDKATRKDMKQHDKQTGVTKVRTPRPMRIPVLVTGGLYMFSGLYFAVYMLAEGLMTNPFQYVSIVTLFVMGFVFIAIYQSAVEADDRTTQIQFGDMPPMPADDHKESKHIFSMDYEVDNPKKVLTGKGDISETETRTFECGRIGDLSGAWPRTPRPIVWVGICQFGNNGGTPNRAGYRVGDVYHIPVVPYAIRYGMLTKTRDKRLAKKLKDIEGLGDQIRPSTWVLLGFRTVSIPQGIPQGEWNTDDLELWRSERLLRKRTDQLHELGYDDTTLEALGM